MWTAGREKINPMNILFRWFNRTRPVDWERTDYAFARRLYRNQEPEYELGSVFAKPIVNTAAAFEFGRPPRIRSDDPKLQERLEAWYKQNRQMLFKIRRNKGRDADVYLRFREKDAEHPDIWMEFVSPGKVDKIPEIVNGVPNWKRTIGYRITEKEPSTQREFVEEVYADRYLYYYNGSRTPYKTIWHRLGFVPIVAFHNEQEEDELYGTSELQPLLPLFKRYHEIKSGAIEAQLYHGQPTPVVEGIKDPLQFQKVNFEKNERGEYVQNWNPNRMLLLGEGTTAKFLTVENPTGNAEMLMKMLFYSICINSETPEFIMGTHVKSSNASVGEQMTPLLKKTERYQGEDEPLLQELNRKFAMLDERLNGVRYKTYETTIVWPDIVDKDGKLTKDVIDSLKANGLITDETALMLANAIIGNPIEDVKAESKAAQEEAKMKRSDDPALTPEQRKLIDEGDPEDVD